MQNEPCLNEPHNVSELSSRSLPPAEVSQEWIVVGGTGSGGIIVRKGADLTSPQFVQRLRTGAIVLELSLSRGRLNYRLAHGQPRDIGPLEGWVSLKSGDKELLRQSVSRIEQRTSSTRAECCAWLEELLRVYSGTTYQMELHRSWDSAPSLVEKAKVRSELHSKAQQILQTKLGYGIPIDMFRSIATFRKEQRPQKYEIKLIAWIAWFCNPAAQSVHIQGPPGDDFPSSADDMLQILVDNSPYRLPTAKVLAKAPFKVCKASIRVFGALSGELLCTFDATLDDQVRHLKAHISRMEGTSTHQQQLVIGEQRLIDMQKVRDLTDASQNNQGECVFLDLVLLRHDAEKAEKLRQLEQGDLNLWDLPPAMETDSDFALAALKRSPLAIKFGPNSLRSNRSFMMDAVQVHGEVLEYASEDLLQDRTLVLKAVETCGNTLRFASPALQNDPEVVLTAVEQEGMALQHASEDMQAIRPIVLAAVGRRGHALTFASSTLQEDPDVVLTALRQTVAVGPHVSKALRSNQSFLQRLEDSGLDPDGSLLDCLMWIDPETAREWSQSNLAFFVEALGEVCWQWCERETEWRKRVRSIPYFRQMVANPQMPIVVYSEHGSGGQSRGTFVARGLRRHPDVSSHRVWGLERGLTGSDTAPIRGHR